MNFISYTGRLICGKKPLQSPTEEICREANKYEMGGLYHYYISDLLTESYKEKFRKQWQNACVYMLSQEAGLRKISQKLENEKIRFAFFKGTDLAFNIYPDPALRTFGDWDILFHPDDCLRALKLLNNDGWQPVYDLSKKCHGHHYSPCGKGKFNIEPHLTLPSFDNTSTYELWKYIEPVSERTYQHRLSTELNIIMLIRHASAFGYTHIHWTRLFSDLAYLVKKENPDMEKLCDLVAKWDYPDPRNILGAFPEFFSDEINNRIVADSAKTKIWKTVFIEQDEFKDAKTTEWKMNHPDIYSGIWFKKNIKSLAVKADSDRTKKAFLLFLLKEIFEKIYLFIRYTFQHNKKIQRRYQQIMDAK